MAEILLLHHSLGLTLPVQIHGMDADPYFVDEGDIEAARELVATADHAELFLYPGNQHFFADCRHMTPTQRRCCCSVYSNSSSIWITERLLRADYVNDLHFI